VKFPNAKILFLSLICIVSLSNANESLQNKEAWYVDPEFASYRIQPIAVLPMENFSFEPEVNEMLQQEVYENLSLKGYRKISASLVKSVMKNLGITTPEMIQGISMKQLTEQLHCNSFIRGSIDQSATIHKGVYDAVVVSCSLELIDIKSGKVIWSTQQWRTAHRQWQVDPINMLLNLLLHEKASRSKRIAWLVHGMMKTLPQGEVNVIINENLLQQAIPINADE